MQSTVQHLLVQTLGRQQQTLDQRVAWQQQTVDLSPRPAAVSHPVIVGPAAPMLQFATKADRSRKTPQGGERRSSLA